MDTSSRGSFKMRSDTKELHIEVDHSDNNQGAQAVAHTYNVDKGPLWIPEHIKIGSKSWDGDIIKNYNDQIDEYEIWLEDQIKAQNSAVLTTLDDIYNKALGAGIILTTRCCPASNVTHAHIVKRVIMNLAGG
jgi:hypothetical protein